MLKRFLLLMFVCCLATSSWGQTTVMLNFQHQFGNSDLAMDTPFSTPAGYDLKIQRLEYYLSELAIVHDGGQITTVPNMWLLVRPEEDSVFNLGVYNIQSIEAINFSVGVDTAVNHADPTAYAAGHPLAPQNPSMHWGWNAGYRFAAVEGYAGTGLVFNYQIHALGDENYNASGVIFDPISTTDTTMLYIKADYSMMFDGVNVSSGPIVHGTTGEAVTLLSNMANSVFSQGETPWATAIEPSFAGKLVLAPNPMTERSYLEYDLPAGHTYQMQLTDLSGRTIQAESIANLQGRLLLEHLQSGLYFVNVFQDGKRVSMDKLSVIR